MINKRGFMKKVLTFLVMLGLGQAAAAECCCNCEKPKPKVKYITKTKVVEKVVEKPVVVTKESVKVVEKPVIVNKTVYRNVQKKNRVNLLGGTGPTKLSLGSDEARLEREAVFGVQYQRSLNNTLSVGVQVQTNQTVLGSAGIDF
jgi:hypothetical protein